MMSVLKLRLFQGDTFVEERMCTAMTLAREAYTPYDEVTATFLAGCADYGYVCRLGLFWGETQVFLGIADKVEQFQKNGVRFVRVHARSFTAQLMQNQLEPGLHSNITIGTLVQGYYQFPNVTYEEDEREGYIYVRERTNLWDCIAHFGYKLTSHYPYVVDNRIMLSLPESAVLHTIAEEAIVESGTVYDTSRLMSHYHMADMEGNPNVYQQSNPAAAEAEIVRHKQIAFDRQYLSEPMNALSFRNQFSQRGWKAKYVVYDGFDNEKVGDRMSYGQFVQNKVICRVRFTFGNGGWRTKLWMYEDGFYN